MWYEFSNVKTLDFKGYKVYVIKKERSVKYQRLLVENHIIIGAFIDNTGEVVGINTYSTDDIYSPKKLLEIFEDNLEHLNTEEQEIVNIPPHKQEELIKWWNNNVKPEQRNISHDVKLGKDELRNYFIETVTTNGDEYEATWYTYYLNPSFGGVEVQLGKDTMVDYGSFSIKKIVLCEDPSFRYKKRMSFYDENERWLEDCDINTNLGWDDVWFIFDSDDLAVSSTVDDEKQSYIGLYENLSPYDSVEDTRIKLRKWFKKNKGYLD